MTPAVGTFSVREIETPLPKIRVEHADGRVEEMGNATVIEFQVFGPDGTPDGHPWAGIGAAVHYAQNRTLSLRRQRAEQVPS